MLGQLFSEVAAGTPLQNEAIVSDQQSQITDPSAQLISHIGFQPVYVVGFHGCASTFPRSLPHSSRQPPCQGGVIRKETPEAKILLILVD
jgi:hypothetical protein